MHIDLKCAKCGNNSFNLGYGVEDDSLITCNFCEHEIGTLAELKDRVAREVLRRRRRV